MKKIFTLFILITTRFVINAQVTSPTFDPLIAAKMQNGLDSIIEANGWRGASCAMFVPSEGTWIGTSGVSFDTVSVTPDMKFNIASNTKIFTAVCIMKLQEMGLLDLDDPISDYLDPIVNVNETATIRQLLKHESGIFDIMLDGSVFADSTDNNPDLVWPVEEQLQFIELPNFNPGEGFEYSNTNYLLTGLIIESITGETYVQKLHDFIFDPLDLDSTFLAYWEPPIYPVSHTFGYYTGTDLGETPPALWSAAWSYGGIFTTANELAQWYKSLFTGEVISESSLKELMTINDFSGLGLGIFKTHRVYPTPEAFGALNSNELYYHGGGWPNFTSFYFYDADTKAVICVLANDYLADPTLICFYLYDLLYQELSKVNNDAGVSDIIAPKNSICQSSVIPQIKFYNYGFSSLTSADIHYGFKGYADNIYNWTGVLSTDNSTLVFLPEIIVEDGEQIFYAYTTSPNGVFDSVTHNDSARMRINVQEVTYTSAPFFENFESGQEVFNHWTNKMNGVQLTTWVTQDFSSYSGNISLAKNNFIDGYTDSYDEIESPIIDIADLTNPTLSFHYAYATRPGRPDKLQVYISNDCGETFIEVFNKDGSDLSTAGYSSTMFFVSDSGFYLETIDLHDYLGGDIIIKFRVTTMGGNTLFIDDVKVANEMVGIVNVDRLSSIIIYPNPTYNTLHIALESPGYVSDKATILIFNMVGDLIYSSIATISDGLLNETIVFDNSVSSGFYLMNIVLDDQKFTERFIISK